MKATSNKAWTIFFPAPSGQTLGLGPKKNIALFRGHLLFSLGVWLALFRVSFINPRSTGGYRPAFRNLLELT